MGNTRDTGYLRDLVTYDGSDNVTFPANVSLVAPAGSDNSTKVPSTAWVRTYVSGVASLSTSGTSGANGSSGSSGQTGAAGSSGSSGQTGAAGSSGSSGSSGQTGAAGSSGSSGSSGQTGAAGSSGSSGQTGGAGSSGSSGSSGQTGAAGSSGSSGQTGGAGSSGSSGQTGGAGSSGSSGSSGQTGGAGSSGTSGTSPSAAAYVAKAGDTMTGLLQLSGQATINTTTPGVGNYGLHFTGQTTADYAAGITWNGGTGTTGAQAGIYVQGSGSYGTKMYIATTDSYAAGSKTAISIDHTGLVNFIRQVPTYAGTSLVYNSGTWGISISGNAATATTATNSSQLNGISSTQIFNNMGNIHGTYTDFNSVGNFGVRYLQGSTNGPGTGASQYYGFTLGLGNEYPLDGAGSYATQFYWNRTSTGGNPYVSVRFKEGNSWGAWSKIYAGYADSAGTATDSSKLPLAGGTMSGPIRRSGHSTTFFEGSYNNVGGNSAYSNPIYTIGSSYNPSDSSLGVMYGIGYAHPNFWGAGKTSSWGLYCANGGVINVTLGEGATSIWAQNDIVAYSDIRVKDNIELVTNAIEKIQAIRGVTFTRKDAALEDKDKRHAGVIAQEVLKVMPEVVTGTEKDMYSVAYGNMAALFIEAIKEQQAQIEDQGSEIRRLKSLIGSLLGKNYK